MINESPPPAGKAKNLRLHSAASRGDIDHIRNSLVGLTLEERRVSANAFNIHGMTPLHSACFSNQLEAVTVLLSMGADPRKQSHSENWTTPLHLAAFAGSSKICKKLLLAGADPFLLDGEGMTALEIAESQGDKELISLLQERMEALRPYYRPTGIPEDAENFALDHMSDEYWRRRAVGWPSDDVFYISDYYSDGGSPPALLLDRRRTQSMHLTRNKSTGALHEISN